jgi:hypothetical protein
MSTGYVYIVRMEFQFQELCLSAVRREKTLSMNLSATNVDVKKVFSSLYPGPYSIPRPLQLSASLLKYQPELETLSAPAVMERIVH